MFHMAFSPDGSKLAAATATRSLRLWDIQAIRATLSESDLDWRAPAIESDGEPRTELKVEIVGK